MRPSEEAKGHGTTMVRLESFTGYNQDTLRRMHKNKLYRFRALCLGALCDELKLTAEQMRAAKVLLKGGKL